MQSRAAEMSPGRRFLRLSHYLLYSLLMKLLIFLSIFIIGSVSVLFFYSWYRLYQQVHIRVTPNIEQAEKYAHLQPQLRYFTTTDTVKIASWYIPVTDPKAIVILVPGYVTESGGKPLMLPHANYLQKAGYSTLLLDLRSVGQSTGGKITFGVEEWKDVEAGYDYVKSLPENKDKKIGFFGISMGGATSLITAGITGKGDFVIASVPFSSPDSLFAYQIQQANVPVGLFLPFFQAASSIEFGMNYATFTPIQTIEKIKVPIFLMAATQDEALDSKDAKVLFDKASQPKTFWQADTLHDMYSSQPEEFERRVLEFIQSSL